MIKQWISKRAKHFDAAKAISELASKENRDLTAEERETFEANMSAAEALTKQIDAAQERERRLGQTSQLLDVTEPVVGQQTGALNSRDDDEDGAAIPLAQAQADTREYVRTATGRFAVPGEVVEGVMSNRAVTGAGARPNLLNDPFRGFRRGPGEFHRAVMKARVHGEIDERLKIGQAAAGANEGTGSEGGFMLPPGFANSLYDAMMANPMNLLPYCDVYPNMTTQAITIPAIDDADYSAGAFAGVTAGWEDEAASSTPQKGKVRQLEFRPRKLKVVIGCTDELLADAAIAQQYIERVASAAIAYQIGKAIINGNGVGQPLGVLNAGSKITVAAEGGQGAATILTENINKMWARCAATVRDSAVWLKNQTTGPQLDAMALAVGVGGMLTYLPQGGLSGNPFATLKGRPAIDVPWCKALGTEGDLILFAGKTYGVFLKGTLETAVSMHVYFLSDQQAFRYRLRMDGKSYWGQAVTPENGDTLSNIVTLASR